MKLKKPAHIGKHFFNTYPERLRCEQSYKFQKPFQGSFNKLSTLFYRNIFQLPVRQCVMLYCLNIKCYILI